MIRRLALVLGLLTASLPTQAAEPAPVAAPEVARFCFEETPAPPWRSRQKVGLYFELLERVSTLLQVRFVYEPLPWPVCLAKVRAGDMDGSFAVGYSRERLEVFAFPSGAPEVEADVLRSDDILLIRRRGSDVHFADGRLYGTSKPIDVLPAYAIADDLRRIGLQVEMSSRDHLAQLSRLVRGDTDAVALSAFRYRQLTAAGGVALSRVEAQPEPLLSKRYYLGLSHAFVAGSPAFAERLWETTRQVRTSATFRAREQAAVNEALTPRP